MLGFGPARISQFAADKDASSRLPASTRVGVRGSLSIPLLALMLALSLGPVPSAALAADSSLSVAERDSAYAAGLSSAETGDRIARHILDKHPYPAGLIWSVPLDGLLALYDATGNQTYFNFARDRIRAYDESDKLGQIQTSGFSLYMRTKDPKDLGDFVAQTRTYRKTVLRAFDGAVSFYDDRLGAGGKLDQLDQESADSMNDGEGRRFYLRKETTPLWLDHLAAYSTQMARAGWLTGEEDFYKESLDQYLIFRAALYDPQTGLWGHGRGWFGPAHEVQSWKFGRAQAWLLRGFGETLPYLPPDSAEFKQVHDMMVGLANTLLRYQDKDGFWHQVVDHPESFQETSATALISFYFARAIREGYLPRERFEAASRKAFAALAKHRISSDGIIYGGAMATPPFRSLQSYLSRPTLIQDPHAVGAVLMAAAGQLLLDGRGGVPVVSVPAR